MADLFGSPIKIGKYALDLLALRHKLIASNIANVETPGYKSRDVEFKELLNDAVDKNHQDMTLHTTHPHHIRPENSSTRPLIKLEGNSAMRNDFNDVDIDKELSKMTQTAMLYKSIVQGIIGKLSILDNVVKGGRR
jgi:flagellar basal-body rod protein FlgB